MRAIAIGLFAVLLTACATSTPKPPADVERVGDGVYLFTSGAHRSLFLVTDAGVIVTDPLNAAAATDYRAAIRRITDQPVRYVVYSHYHWDRVSGAAVFADAGATVVAQRRCAERFAANPNPAVVMPDILFEDEYRIELGGRALELYYFGPSHGDCLTVFLTRPAPLIQVVDLVEPPGASFPSNPNVPYVRPHNLRRFFDRLEALVDDKQVTTVLASHAGPGIPPTAPASIIDDQARFWDEIYAAVATARAEGNVGIDSFVKLKTIDLTRFEPFDGYAPDELPVIMRRFVGYYDMGR